VEGQQAFPGKERQIHAPMDNFWGCSKLNEPIVSIIESVLRPKRYFVYSGDRLTASVAIPR
jgi:hypothetical protein